MSFVWSMITRLAALLAVVLAPTWAQAQTFASPGQLVSQLQQEGARSPLARSLRLSSCGSQSPCSGADVKIQVRYPRLDPAKETAVIEIEGLQAGDLAVLVHDPDGRWTWVDTLPLDYRYERLRLEFTSLVKAPVEEIVIHNNTALAGTGIYQGHLLIVKLVRANLRVVLGVTEKENASPVGGTAWSAVSTFRLEPTGPTTPGMRGPARVVQATTYEVGSQKRTLVRTFVWDERYQVFLPEIDDPIR